MVTASSYLGAVFCDHIVHMMRYLNTLIKSLKNLKESKVLFRASKHWWRAYMARSVNGPLIRKRTRDPETYRRLGARLSELYVLSLFALFVGRN